MNQELMNKILRGNPNGISKNFKIRELNGIWTLINAPGLKLNKESKILINNYKK